jgi:hypothetical protein
MTATDPVLQRRAMKPCGLYQFNMTPVSIVDRDSSVCITTTLNVPIHVRVWLASPTGLASQWVKLVRVWSVTSRTWPFIYTVEPRFTNTPVHEQLGSRKKFYEQKRLAWRKVSRITNTQAGNSGNLRVSARECQLLVNFGSVQSPACIRRAFCWISLCFVLFFNILLNKTPWDQRRIMIAKLNEVLVYILSV